MKNRTKTVYKVKTEIGCCNSHGSSRKRIIGSCSPTRAGRGFRRKNPCLVLRIKAALMGMTLLSAAAGMAGCGTKETIEATIWDGTCRTIISAVEGETVEEVLARAEIVLSDNDEVLPAEEETLSETDPIITINRYAEVTVSDGDSTTRLELTGGTVQDALDAADIALNENDRINHELTAYLTTGMEITVERFYSVTLSVTGEEQTLITDLTTVAQLLEDQGIVYDEDDRVSPSVEEPLYDGMIIEVEYVSTAQITEEEEIAFETVYQDSDTLYEGETEVLQKGENGIRTCTYEVTYVEGKEESRTLVSEEVTKEAADEIILVGTKEKAAEKNSESNTGSSGSNTASSETSSKSSGSTGESGSGNADSDGDGSGQTEDEDEFVSSDGRKIVSKEKIYDCDGSGNGYYVITYEDGTVEYEDFYDPDAW